MFQIVFKSLRINTTRRNSFVTDFIAFCKLKTNLRAETKDSKVSINTNEPWR